jgi:hypothetical protein
MLRFIHGEGHEAPISMKEAISMAKAINRAIG